MELSEYEYDLFLSWTGVDRETKDQIKQYFAEKYPSLRIYDSDEKCKGEFRSDYIASLQKSKVYLLILTDNLRTHTPGKHITEVRSELSMAREWESYGYLNISILCLSSFFRFNAPYRVTSDDLEGFFYVNTRGFSFIDGVVQDGKLADSTLAKIAEDVTDFVNKRNAGKPALSQRPKFEIQTEKFDSDESFCGRSDEIKSIDAAFSKGAQVVVLSGMGGMGKTKLAEEYAALANSRESLRCLQIVRIQEDAGERDGLKLLVSGTRYEKSLVDSIANFNREERYDRKLEALKELPDYTLVVLDNYNSLSPEGMEDLLRFLNCRLLITTRVRPEEGELGKKVEVVQVDELPPEQAYRMFVDTSRRKASKEDFETLYKILGGHTITICIIAKILREQKSLTLAEITANMRSLGDLSQKTSFKHNDSNDYATLIEHLKGLYDASRLDDECKAVLANLSMIASGKMGTEDILAATDAQNENALLTLKNLGWLEPITLGGADGVYLHPILSQIVFETQRPDIEAVKGAVRYLCDRFDEKQEKLSYEDAQFMQDALYYALQRLAATSHELNDDLWQRFVKLSEFLGQAADLKQKSDALVKHLPAPAASLVNSHCDMVTLENNPTNIELLDKFVSSLEENAPNYKWVMQALSTSSRYVTESPEHKQRLAPVLHKAFEAAKANDDDFSILAITPHLLLADPKGGKTALREYVRKRKRAGEKGGTVLLLDTLCDNITAYGGLKEMIQSIPEVIENPEKFGMRMLRRHPLIAFKSWRTTVKALKLPEDDAMKFYWLANERLVNTFVYEDTVDAMALFEIAVGLYQRQYEQGLTLATIDQIIANVLAMIKMMPKVQQDEIRQIANILPFSTDELAMGDLPRLHVAMLFNSQNGDITALQQSKLLLDAEKKWHAQSHNAVIAALIRHANTCVTFWRNDDALKYFLEAFDILKDTAPDSKQTEEVCNAILNNRAVGTLSPSQIKEIAKFGLASSSYDAYNSTIMKSSYINALLAANVNNRETIMTRISKMNLHGYLVQNMPKYVLSVLRKRASLLGKVTNPLATRFAALAVLVECEKDLRIELSPKNKELLQAELMRGDPSSLELITPALTMETLDAYENKLKSAGATDPEDIAKIEAIPFCDACDTVRKKKETSKEDIIDELLNLFIDACIKCNVTRNGAATAKQTKPVYGKSKAFTQDDSATIRQAAEDVVNYDKYLSEAVKVLLKSGFEIEKYPASTQKTIVDTLKNCSTNLVNNHVFGYIDEFRSCYEYILKCGTPAAKAKAEILIPLEKARTLFFFMRHEGALPLFEKALKACLRHKTDADSARYSTFMILSNQLRVMPEDATLSDYIDILVGKKGAPRKKIDARIETLISENEFTEEEIFESLKDCLITAAQQAYKGFEIKDEFYRVIKKGFNKYKRLLAAALEEFLGAKTTKLLGHTVIRKAIGQKPSDSAQQSDANKPLSEEDAARHAYLEARRKEILERMRQEEEEKKKAATTPPAGCEIKTDDEPKRFDNRRPISRNEPCPCGSGKKYKDCCGKNNL